MADNLTPKQETSKQVAVAEKRKPPAAGRGRKKGAVNKITKTIREAVELSFHKIGGAEYLVKMAEEQPVAYMTLLGKVLPQQIDHKSSDGSMTPKVIDPTKLSTETLRELQAARDAAQ